MKNIFLNKLFLILFISSALLFAQEKKEFRFSVSYVASSIVYVDAGREQNISIGDSLIVYRDSTEIAKILVTAVSRKSTAAQIISELFTIKVGDVVKIEKIILLDVLSATDTLTKKKSEALLTEGKIEPKILESNENIFSGRVSFQYSGSFAEDSRFNLNQPSVLIRMDGRNLYGTGITFSMYGRTFYDLSKNYNRYGETSRTKMRMYEFLVEHNLPDNNSGYGIGRMTSRYVGGLGTFDGLHYFRREGNFTAGVLLGARVQDRTMAIDGDDKKGALFLNYHYAPDFTNQYDGTIAYGKQLMESKLDREFIYIQNSATINQNISIYESTEIELNDISNGKRKNAFKLSNTFLSVNYYPNNWLTTNFGFDATRSVYLFETMKEIPDTLFDKNLMYGYRANATVRLPYFISISGNVHWMTKKEDSRDAKNFSSTFRINDILSSGINFGARYANITGIFSDGNNFTLDLDKTFFYNLSVTLRYDNYKYKILTQNQNYLTQTGSVNLHYRFTKSFYSTLTVDKIFDTTMNSLRVFIEAGIRF